MHSTVKSLCRKFATHSQVWLLQRFSQLQTDINSPSVKQTNIKTLTTYYYYILTLLPLSKHQWEFTAGRLTVTALLWQSALDSGDEVCSILFDYAKPLIRSLTNTPAKACRTTGQSLWHSLVCERMARLLGNANVQKNSEPASLRWTS